MDRIRRWLRQWNIESRLAAVRGRFDQAPGRTCFVAGCLSLIWVALLGLIAGGVYFALIQKEPAPRQGDPGSKNAIRVATNTPRFGWSRQPSTPGQAPKAGSAATPRPGGKVTPGITNGVYPDAAWYAQTIDASPRVGVFSDLAIGPGGEKAVAYLDDAADDLKIAVQQRDGWEVAAVPGRHGGQDGWYPSLAYDPQGGLHVAYYAYSDRQVVYGSRDPDGKWRLEAAAGEVSALDTNLMIGANGVPHIIFFDEASSQLRQAVQQGGHWDVTTIVSAEAAGVTFPAAAGTGGAIHTVFLGSNGSLNHAWRGSADWQIETIAGSQGGQYPALALDPNGSPRVSFYDPARGDLKYAFRDPQGWRVVTVDAQGDVGQYSALAVDSEGTAHISYYDAGQSALKYAAGQGEKWFLSLVSDEGDVGQYNALRLDAAGTPFITYQDASASILMVAYREMGSQHVAQPQKIQAAHRSGQTFLTWAERADLPNEVYRVYRDSAPIDASSLEGAELLAQIGEGSSKFWANYNVGAGFWQPRLSEFLILEDGAAPVGKGSGVFVWTLAAQDFGGAGEGQGYYAVTIQAQGSPEEVLYAGYSVGPVQESVSPPAPVEITNSPGLRASAQAGGHFYLQYMDFRSWNPTFHAPNATNRFYGLEEQAQEGKNALAYTYDYYVFEPTPDICGGKVPQTLPVMVFLHGHRTNRYGPIEQYPYPYCAYGVYPIDVSETWYFGFARDYDYRAGGDFASDDVVVNYTEQRVLRMVADLIRVPPGPAVDTQRVYLFGHSMGGTGSLAFAERYPNVFAAIYSGQPVTVFSPVMGDDHWAQDVSVKWGPQDLNLPVQIDAPNGWAEPLQQYNGAGVYVWQNLQLAFSPDDPLQRYMQEMVPFGIDHGIPDDAVLFPSQGQPLYPLLHASPRTWAGAITNDTHQWSVFAWALPNLGVVDGVPFWRMSVVRDETVPGLSQLRSDPAQAVTAPQAYNQTILWSASWNAWDGAPVDQPEEWQMSLCAVEARKHRCGGEQIQVVDITPRRLQNFRIIPGQRYGWEVRAVKDNALVASGVLAADESGTLTVPGVAVPPQGIRLRIIPGRD